MSMNDETIFSSGPERPSSGPAFPKGPPAGTSQGRVRKALERGVTLVEVLIVVAIIAMVASGVAVFALPRYKEAQIKSAETGARVIRGAIQNWQRINNESTCPTVSQLVQEKHLDSASNTADPWNEQYQLSCSDDDVTVSSNGPDKKKGTPDDIRVPKGAVTGTQ